MGNQGPTFALIKINQAAQELITLEEFFTWFDASDATSKNRTMMFLDLCLWQSHPTDEEIEEGIHLSGLKQTYTPVVIIRKNNLTVARNKLQALPEHEWKKVLTLMLHIFSVADMRRKKACGDDCSHWWHALKNE